MYKNRSFRFGFLANMFKNREIKRHESHDIRPSAMYYDGRVCKVDTLADNTNEARDIWLTVLSNNVLSDNDYLLANVSSIIAKGDKVRNAELGNVLYTVYHKNGKGVAERCIYISAENNSIGCYITYSYSTEGSLVKVEIVALYNDFYSKYDKYRLLGLVQDYLDVALLKAQGVSNVREDR